jgi:2'-5' RNA ligase
MAFWGIRVVGEIKHKTSSLIEELQAMDIPADWDHPDDYHLTLKFLKEVKNEDIPRLTDAATPILKEFAPFSLPICGVHTFERRGRVRIIWLGLGHESVILNRLADKLDQLCSNEGYPSQNEIFTPHITLGRIRRQMPGLQEKLSTYRKIEIGTLQVDEIHFMKRRKKSDREPHGPLYQINFCHSLL